MKTMNPFRSFRSGIALTFGIAMLVLAGLISVLASQSTRFYIHANVSNHMVDVAYQLADKLDRGMFERYRDTRVAATLLQLQRENFSLAEKRELLQISVRLLRVWGLRCRRSESLFHLWR